LNNNNRQVTFEEGKTLSKIIDCPYIEVTAKSSDNINKMFYSILIEIKKFENNIKIKNLSCKRLFEFFIKYQSCLTAIFYILMIINIVYNYTKFSY